jgi:predicted metalloprotease
MPLDDRDDAEQPKRGTGRYVLGLFGLIGLILSALLFGFNPLSFLGGGEKPRVDRAQKAPEQGKAPGTYGCEVKTTATTYACQLLTSANATWAKAFPPGRYQGPELVFYTRQGRSGCSAAPMASGPFYCPTDRKIYLDMDFTTEVSQRFGAVGKPAQAYVIAHAVGHHIQYVTGIVDQVEQYDAKLPEAEKTKLRIAKEVQADCYAGVWAAQHKDLLTGDKLEAGLRAAHRVAEDSLPKLGSGRLVPEQFALGSLTERLAWLRRGLQAADPDKCDPFPTIRIKP